VAAAKVAVGAPDRATALTRVLSRKSLRFGDDLRIYSARVIAKTDRPI